MGRMGRMGRNTTDDRVGSLTEKLRDAFTAEEKAKEDNLT